MTTSGSGTLQMVPPTIGWTLPSGRMRLPSRRRQTFKTTVGRTPGARWGGGMESRNRSSST